MAKWISSFHSQDSTGRTTWLIWVSQCRSLLCFIPKEAQASKGTKRTEQQQTSNTPIRLRWPALLMASPESLAGAGLQCPNPLLLWFTPTVSNYQVHLLIGSRPSLLPLDPSRESKGEVALSDKYLGQAHRSAPGMVCFFSGQPPGPFWLSCLASLFPRVFPSSVGPRLPIPPSAQPLQSPLSSNKAPATLPPQKSHKTGPSWCFLRSCILLHRVHSL